MAGQVQIVLGTAQWGSDYGITNVTGRPSDQALQEIIEVAKSARISKLDTAARYGDAHKRIARWLSEFDISTKVGGGAHSSVWEEFHRCLQDLGAQNVDTLLIHDWDDLTPIQMRDSAKALVEIRREGLAKNIGVSTYGDTYLERARREFDFLDVVQVPINALDGRLVASKLIQEIHDAGTRVQARSIMLQGLLASRSESTLGQHPLVKAFHDEYLDQAPCQAMAFVKAIPWVDEMVLGVSQAVELGALIECLEFDGSRVPNRKFNTNDLSLIDPRRWGKDSV